MAKTDNEKQSWDKFGPYTLGLMLWTHSLGLEGFLGSSYEKDFAHMQISLHFQRTHATFPTFL